MWQGKWTKGVLCTRFFANFWIKILCPVFVIETQKMLKKLKKTSKKTYIFISCGKESAVLITVRIVIMELFDVYLLLFQALF